MPHYRVTIRYGAPRALYEVLDLEVADLRTALREAASQMPESILETAELAEVRRLRADDERSFMPE